MWNILNELRNIRANIYNRIGSEIQNVLGNITTGVSNYVVKPLSNDVSNVLDRIGNSVDYLEQQANSGIQRTLSTVGNALRTTEQKAVSGFDRTMSSVEQAVITIAKDISTGLDDVVTGIENGFAAIHNGIVSVFKTISTSVEAGVKYLADKLLAGIKDVIVPLTQFIESLPKDIESFIEAVGANIKDLAVNIKDFELKWAVSLAKEELKAGKEIEKIMSAHTDVSFIKKLTGPNWSGLSNLLGIDIERVNKGMFGRLIGGIGTEIALSSLAEKDAGLAYMLGQQLPPLMNVVLKASWRNLEQAANAETPNVLLGVGEAIGAKYKGYISDNYFYEQLEQAGFNKENADIMYKTSDTLLGLSELISLYFRGDIKSLDDLYTQAGQVRANKYQVDQSINLFLKLFGPGESVELWRRDIMPDNFKDFFDDLRNAGYNKARIDAIKKASYKLPSLDQQKKFGYRKIYDPESVKKYEYDYELDAKYLEIAKANGFDEKTAIDIYRGSWEPAPFFITEGLFSRGKISEETFTELLLLDGYTPYWVKTFIHDMSPTLALGDIKDLYKYQVITADQIVEQVMSIGYSKELAEQYKHLWMASIKLAGTLDQTKTQAKAEKIKGDTESLIKNAYKDKLINKAQALEDFRKINVSAEAAQLNIDILDYEIEQKHITDTYQEVLGKLKSKAITFNKAIDELQVAGATADQIVMYTEKLDKATAVRERIPTLSEFANWYKKGIITAEMLAEGMKILGYADVWIPFFLLEYKVPAKTVQKLFNNTSHPLKK